MIHPSYTELMEAINEGAELEDEPLVTSRYSVVLATSKRARQLIAGREPMVPAAGKKPLSTAVEEIYKGKVHILPEDPETEEEEN
ncbi:MULTISPECIES: DNA-directed RNA polymerase subunit omega [unclassified Blautia]|uniref:DNA-directed RNA polymerase subunit omega n=1 Tax=unclassified Blautia TaxID=2648079 RepID=UPI000B39348F|nr:MULTISPECIES: DNA-directed RNA polymerase subunit omega [unclassified Blautia]OUN31233.1 DNA-directed RNA polymerase subunit omega [Blautia sp. An81]OUN92662.1 DNA-directed RNA polymerase subunit omega [Blautia sp. An46]HJD36715.1 DNA-directed RNA polymerase subunit omega [Candidatus Blautia ornithocaccae]